MYLLDSMNIYSFELQFLEFINCNAFAAPSSVPRFARRCLACARTDIPQAWSEGSRKPEPFSPRIVGQIGLFVFYRKLISALNDWKRRIIVDALLILEGNPSYGLCNVL